jgi:hypothetical protein
MMMILMGQGHPKKKHFQLISYSLKQDDVQLDVVKQSITCQIFPPKLGDGVNIKQQSSTDHIHQYTNGNTLFHFTKREYFTAYGIISCWFTM